MNFKSDAALIRHYFEELLSDGNKYTIYEVVAYIIRAYGDTALSGAAINYAKVQNVLHQFLRSGKSGYVMPCRGSYIKGEALVQNQAIQTVALNPIHDNALRILAAAEIGVRNCFMSYMSIMEITGDYDTALRDTGQDVIALLEQAIRKIKELKTHRCNFDSAVLSIVEAAYEQ